MFLNKRIKELEQRLSDLEQRHQELVVFVNKIQTQFIFKDPTLPYDINLGHIDYQIDWVVK